MSKSIHITPRLLKGFRDYMPKDLAIRNRIINRAAQAFEQFGFQPLETPALEYSEVLMGKYGTEGEKLLYRFRDNGDRDISMRYDLTVPLARVVAQHRPNLPFKRYQVGPVWRAEKPARGRFREFMQFDIDIAGAQPPVADAEILIAGISALRNIGVTDFRVRLNHRGLLNAVLLAFGVEDSSQEEVLRSLDKLEKAGLDAVTEMIAGAIGDPVKAEKLTKLVAGQPGLDELDIGRDGHEAALELGKIIKLCQAAGMGDYIRFDLSIARGLDYYTGVVFETQLTNLPQFGSIMSGGRYDGLIGVFMNAPVPAVGISIGIDRLVAAMHELGALKAQPPAVDVEVLAMDEEMLERAFAVAAVVRDAGYSCEVYPAFRRKLKAQLTYAAKRGIKHCILIGPDEEKEGTVVVRDMATSSQHTPRIGRGKEVLEETGQKVLAATLGGKYGQESES